jgi:hypothetical protein
MTLTLLAIGAMIALTSVYAVATRTAEMVDPVVTTETTVVGLSDPAAETLSGDTKTPVPQGEWQLATLNSLREAEELLDCLERQGFQERELVLMSNSCFAIKWR